MKFYRLFIALFVLISPMLLCSWMQPPASPVTTVAGSPVTNAISTPLTLFGNSTTIITNTNVPVTNVLSTVVTLFGNSTTLITNPNVAVSVFGNGGTITSPPGVPITLYGNSTTLITNTNVPVTNVLSTVVTLYGNSTTLIANPNVPVTAYGGGGTILGGMTTPVTLYGNSTTIIANTNVPVTNVLSTVVTLFGNSTTLIANPNVPVTTYGGGGTVLSGMTTPVTLYGNSTTVISNPNVPVTTVQNGGSTPTTMVMNAAVSLTGNPTFSSVTVSGAVSTGTLNAAGNSTLAGVVDSAALSVSGASSLVGNQFINGVETTLLPFANAVFWSPDMSRTNTTFNPASATAYFVYIGEVMSAFTPKYVRFYQSTAGTLSVNEVGIFSSTSAPDAANQTLTKITSGTFTAGTGVIKNGSAFSTALTVGQHIWVGFNSTWSVQPVLNGLADDYATGSYLTVASPTAFASGTSYSGVFVSTMSALTGVCPDLVLTNN